MDILFVVMPFAEPDAPAIGVSLLRAELERAGLRADIRYFALDFAEEVGTELYDALAGRATHKGVADAPPTESLLGEWFFSHLVFDREPAEAEAYLSRYVAPNPTLRRLTPRILEHRSRLEGFVDRCVEQILDAWPPVVGFTTTFYQTCPALAVARRIKQAVDPPVVMFGGANCAGPMGLQMIRSFPWIDWVCTGEGDLVVPEFLANLRQGTLRPVPGILGRGDDHDSRPPMVTRMDELPIPDYTDYFEQLEASPLRRSVEPKLLIESARGCWWGAKHHCTFCGLNAEGMVFRAKSADRVHRELSVLRETYGVRRVDCIDNILHMQYLRTLMPQLAADELDVDLFYETKANLRLDQLHLLKRAGVWGIQPGIESFSDEVLALMRKGCTGVQNIQVLRWGREVGLEIIWNIVYGFPGESPLEYERMAALIPLLTHLEPPAFAVPIRLDRFSPNFTEAAERGLTNVRPAGAYRHVYPLEDEALANLAYFFDFDYADGRDPRRYTANLQGMVDEWAELGRASPYERPRLDLSHTNGEIRIHDTRPCAANSVHILDELQQEVYLRCDLAQRPARLSAALASKGVAEADVRAALDGLVDARLMVCLNGKYVSLAVFRARAQLEQLVARREAVGSAAPVGR